MSDLLSTARRRIARYLRRDTPLHASTMSLLACIVLAGGSLLLGLVEKSLIVQTNGLIALIDIGNSLLFIAAVERSTRSPDMAFNYGYGKYESLAILVSANLLIVVTIFTLINAVSVIEHPPVDSNTWLLGTWAALSFVLMRNTARRLERYAKRFHQPMLRYDAELWRVDSVVEIGVVAMILINGLLQYLGWISTAAVMDSVASIGLVLITLKAPLTHGREAFRQLLDRTLPDRMQYEILAIIADNTNRMCEFKGVHTRQSGRDIFIEIDLVMPYDYSLEHLYDLEQEILKRLRATFPTAVPRVYVTPCDHSCDLPEGTMCPVKKMVL